MYIIGVTGPSGAGKTEFGKILAKENSRVYSFNFDEIWFEVAYEHRADITEQFGEKVFRGNGLCNTDYWFTFNKSKVQKWLRDFAPEMVEKFYQRARQLSDLHDIFIAEYHFLPATSLWQSCDKRVIVESNETERYERLQSRNFCPCSPIQAQRREEMAAELWVDIGKSNYITIRNNYDEGYQAEVLSLFEDVLIDIGVKTPIFA